MVCGCAVEWNNIQEKYLLWSFVGVMDYILLMLRDSLTPRNDVTSANLIFFRGLVVCIELNKYAGLIHGSGTYVLRRLCWFFSVSLVILTIPGHLCLCVIKSDTEQNV